MWHADVQNVAVRIEVGRSRTVILFVDYDRDLVGGRNVDQDSRAGLFQMECFVMAVELLGGCTCQALLVSRSIDNARSDEGQFVRIRVHASHRPRDGFSGDASLVLNR